MEYRIRKLTPKECWRLMGFKDEQFLKAEQVCSNSQLYKQAYVGRKRHSAVIALRNKIY